MSAKTRLVLLGVVAAVILFSRLGDRPLGNFDDCYYAQKAKEMLAGGDWLTPHFAGVVRLDNPPLFVWLVAIGFRIFGVSSYGAAFFSAAAGLGSVLLLVRLARRLRFDEFTAFGAGAVLITTQYFVKYAGHAMMDVTLTLFFLIALDGYLSGVEGRARGWVQLGVATGLGLMMKSVLGLFPLIVAAIHRLTVRGPKAAIEPGPWNAAAAALAVGAPWFAYEFAVHHDVLLNEHFRWLLWSRGFVEPAGSGHAGNDPWGYFIRLGNGYWPWLPFALAGAWLELRRAFDRSRDPEERSTARLLLLWLVIVFGTMSLGHVKRLWYVMSIFPCLALLSAIAAARFLPSENARRRTVTATLGVLVTIAGLFAMTPLGVGRPRNPELNAMARIIRANVPAGQPVVNLDTPYWDVINTFIFYSDHDLGQPLADPTRVREQVRGGAWALVSASRAAEVVGTEPSGCRVVARSGPWALIASKEAAVLAIPPID